MKRQWFLPVAVVLVVGGLIGYFLVARNKAPQAGDLTRVKLYYANTEYVRTGDESLPRVLPEEREVDVSTRPVAEAAVRGLTTPPRSERLGTALEKLRLNGVHVREGIAYVDFAKAGLNGGSLEERLVVEQVVKTLTELEGIQAVQFLVDGKEPETLMGHIYVQEPLTRGDVQ